MIKENLDTGRVGAGKRTESYYLAREIISSLFGLVVAGCLFRLWEHRWPNHDDWVLFLLLMFFSSKLDLGNGRLMRAIERQNDLLERALAHEEPPSIRSALGRRPS